MKPLDMQRLLLLFLVMTFCPFTADSQDWDRDECAAILKNTLQHAGIVIDTSCLSVGAPQKVKKRHVANMRYDDGRVSFDAVLAAGKKSVEVKVSGTHGENGSLDLSCDYDSSLRIVEFKDARNPYHETWEYFPESILPQTKNYVFDTRTDVSGYFPVMAGILKIDSLYIEAGDAVSISCDYLAQRPVSVEITGRSGKNAMLLNGFCKATFDLGFRSEARAPFRTDPFDNDFNTPFDFLPGINPLVNFIQFINPDGSPAESRSGVSMVRFEYVREGDSLANTVRFENIGWNAVDVEFLGCRFSSVRELAWIDDDGYENYSIKLSDSKGRPAANSNGLSGYATMASDSSVYVAAYGSDTKYVPLADFLSMGRFGLYWSTKRERDGNDVYQVSFRGYDDDDPVVCYMGFSDMVITYSGKSGIVKHVFYYGPDGEPALHAKYRCARISTRFSSAGEPLSLGLYDTDGELIRVIPYKEYAPEDYQFYNPELEP